MWSIESFIEIDMKRTFIGIGITLGQPLTGCYNTMLNHLGTEGIVWVPKENFHITLKFLGKTTHNQEEKIKEFLNELSNRLYGFSFLIKKLGYFGRKNSPQVIWAGIEENENLSYLHKIINNRLVDFGFEPEEKVFRPHLTLARIKSKPEIQTFQKDLEKYKDEFFQEVLVEKLSFYESKLSQEGARYFLIDEFELSQ